MNYLPLPYVYERDGRGEKAWDIYSRLLKDRIVFIGTPIDDFVANAVIAQLLFLQMEDPKKDVHLYINCPGGSVTAGMAIYDTMNFLNCDIVTYCVGQAASMATVLLAAGTRGKRYARWRSTINSILAEHSSQSVQQIEKDSDRDFFLSAQEAADYGLVDHVIINNPQKSTPSA